LPEAPQIVDASVEFDAVAAGGLDGVSFHVPAGAFVGVACSRDGDATAVADVLARRIEPEAGCVRVGGVDLRTIPLDHLHHAIVVADTDRPWLRAGTVLENLQIARADIAEDGAWAALHTAAGEDILRRREPLQATIGERGLRLSGGQRQRVAVARSLLAQPTALVLVEPTSALDAATEQVLISRLAGQRVATTIVLSTSPAVLAACDHVVTIDGGRVRGGA